MRLASRVLLPAFVLAASPGTHHGTMAAQSAAIQGYAPSTVGVGWGTGPGNLFGPGFTFTPTTELFATALSFFNPDFNGGARGFSSSGDPSLATVFTVVLSELNSSGGATALVWANVDDASMVRAVSTGGITGAFFSTALATPFVLQTGRSYAVFAGTDQGLLSVGAGWDTGTVPPAPVTSSLIEFGNYIGGAVATSDLGVSDGVSLFTPPDPSTAFSTGASLELTTAAPEPATAVLMAAGLVGLGAATRRRRFRNRRYHIPSSRSRHA